MENTPIKHCEFCGAQCEPIVIDGLDRHSVPGGHMAYERRKVVVGFKPCSCPDASRNAERLERERTEKERAKAAKELELRCRRAGIPPMFLGAETDEMLVSKVMGGCGLYIQGPNGTGKTHLAMGLAKRVIEMGKTAKVTSSVRIKGELFSTFGRKETEEDVFAHLARPHLLVIDDLGKECDSKAVVSMLYRVVNDRYEQMRPVVITTNFAKDALCERLAESGDVSAAEAIVSRLFGMTEKVELGGEDRRLQ